MANLAGNGTGCDRLPTTAGRFPRNRRRSAPVRRDVPDRRKRARPCPAASGVRGRPPVPCGGVTPPLGRGKRLLARAAVLTDEQTLVPPAPGDPRAAGPRQYGGTSRTAENVPAHVQASSGVRERPPVPCGAHADGSTSRPYQQRSSISNQLPN